jgi:hypothetical protein
MGLNFDNLYGRNTTGFTEYGRQSHGIAVCQRSNHICLCHLQFIVVNMSDVLVITGVLFGHF